MFRKAKSSTSAPVQAVPVNPLLSAKNLLAVKTLQDEKVRLASELQAVDEALKAAEFDIIGALRRGEQPDPKGPLVSVRTKERRLVPYKAICESQLGAVRTAELAKEYPPKTYDYLAIMLRENA